MSVSAKAATWAWFRARGWVFVTPVALLLAMIGLMIGLKLSAARPAPPAIGVPRPETKAIPLPEAERREGFGAARWGMSAEEVAAAMGGAAAMRGGHWLDHEVWLAYNFDAEGRLSEVSAVFSAASAEAPEGFRAFVDSVLIPHLDRSLGAAGSAQEVPTAVGRIGRWTWEGPYTHAEVEWEERKGRESLKAVFQSATRRRERLSQQEQADREHQRRKTKVFRD